MRFGQNHETLNPMTVYIQSETWSVQGAGRSRHGSRISSETFAHNAHDGIGDVTRPLRLTLSDLDLQAAEYNRLVAQSLEVDRFCSSTHWIIPAHQAFSGNRQPWILRLESGYVALAVGYRLPLGMVLEPLEAIWGLACPFVSQAPEQLVAEFARHHLASRRTRIPLLLSGLRRDGVVFQHLWRYLSSQMRLIIGRTTRSFRASLEGGEDGFLSRRTPRFRTNLRRSQRLGQQEGIAFETFTHFESWSEILARYRRIVQIEAGSWKGQAGTGLGEPAMEDFYHRMLARIWQEQSLRVIIARKDGEDVGFVFGAIFQDCYRGLQVSFDQRFARVSLGNLLQWEMIGLLAQEQCLLYDLGVEVAYKERWGEQVLESVQLLAF